MRVNINGTPNLLSPVREAGVRALVYTSSASVIHDDVLDINGADETAPVLRMPELREAYSYTMGLADDLLLQARAPDAGFRTLSLRPSTIFGEGDFTTMSRFFELGKTGKACMQMGEGRNLFGHTHAGNFAGAQLLAAEALLKGGATGGREHAGQWGGLLHHT